MDTAVKSDQRGRIVCRNGRYPAGQLGLGAVVGRLFDKTLNGDYAVITSGRLLPGADDESEIRQAVFYGKHGLQLCLIAHHDHARL